MIKSRLFVSAISTVVITALLPVTQVLANVVQAGNHIYYPYENSIAVENAKTNSGKHTVIKTVAGVGNIQVVGDWIYYETFSGLYKVRTNGKDNTTLFHTNDQNNQVNGFQVVGNQVFYGYITNLGSNYHIYRMTTNGTDNKLMYLNSDNTHTTISKFLVAGKYIYLTEGIANWSIPGSVFKVSVNGGKVSTFLHNVIDIHYVNGWLYYSISVPPHFGYLYREKLDGSVNQRIGKAMNIGQFEVAGNWIYFGGSDIKGVNLLYKLNVDTSQEYQMTTDDYGSMVFDVTKYFAYVQSQYRDEYVRIDSGTPVELDGNPIAKQVNSYQAEVAGFAGKSGTVYFSDGNGDSRKVNFKSDGSMKLNFNPNGWTANKIVLTDTNSSSETFTTITQQVINGTLTISVVDTPSTTPAGGQSGSTIIKGVVEGFPGDTGAVIFSKDGAEQSAPFDASGNLTFHFNPTGWTPTLLMVYTPSTGTVEYANVAQQVTNGVIYISLKNSNP